MTAHVLFQVRRKLLQPPSSADTQALTDTDPSTWAAPDQTLKDVRDTKESQLISKVMGEVSRDRIPQALDLLTMRLREIRMAKGQGGSWEKVAALSLVPGEGGVPVTQALPDGAMEL